MSPLKKEISVGNTFINLFKDMEDVELASVYARAGVPDVEISKAFCITEKMIVRNLFGKAPAGVCVEERNTEQKVSKDSNEKKGLMNFVKSSRWTIFFWMQKFVWNIGKWKSSELKNFVEEYNPDIIFTVLSDSSFLNKLILHIKAISNKPLVLYAWDNNYSMKRLMFSPLKWIDHFMNRCMMKKTAKNADLMYVISDVQKQDYEKAFDRECKVLTKGHDFLEQPENKTPNKPLKLVYTGNVGMNRWKALSHVVNVLEKINANDDKAQLEIYTGNEISKRMKKALEKGNSCSLMGAVSSAEVAEIQKNADILVHVESTDLKNRLLVRQSFSTKLVDYFHQGKCIVAYGPKDVASISHLEKNDAAVVADNEKELEYKLRQIVEAPDMLLKYGKNAWECGKKNHNSKEIQKMLEMDFSAIASV